MVLPWKKLVYLVETVAYRLTFVDLSAASGPEIKKTTLSLFIRRPPAFIGLEMCFYCEKLKIGKC